MHLDKRASGVLLHITSLPSKYGIGTLGKEAELFADWLVKAGQRYWQILPLAPTGYGDSPYQSPSAFAGNPLLIDLERLAQQGLLSQADLETLDYGADPAFVDFERVSKGKIPLLEKAAKLFDETPVYLAFTRAESWWLDDYALFMSVKEKNNGKPWYMWDDGIKARVPSVMSDMTVELAEKIKFHKFAQFMFYDQWGKLRSYCNRSGIKIIGDIPIYAAEDSADVWANPDLFQLGGDLRPTAVAGVPPDCFSEDGQLWGNTLYDWEAMKDEKYQWWIERVKKSCELYDVVRIDHFRAFDTYYSVRFGEKTARIGEWKTGPGMDLFDAITAAMKDAPPNIIAEDLGDLFDSVRVLLKNSGYPGMKILQFAFNPENSDNTMFPHVCEKNYVVYTGTHDNSTIKGWVKTQDKRTLKVMRGYIRPALFESIPDAFIRTALATTANTAIIPAQDILGLDDKARMNIPSTVGDNWQWRIKPGQLKNSHARKMAYLTELFHRK